MIRIGLPPPMLPRLRPRWVATQEQFLRRVHVFQESLHHKLTVWKAWWATASSWVIVRLGLRARSVAREHALFQEFSEKYDALVDLLCWAAQDGVHTHRDQQYMELRTWMCSHYRILRPALRTYCRKLDPTCFEDPFEALFAPENVELVLHDDSSIDNMTRARLVLDSYGCDLEQAAKGSIKHEN